MVENIPISKDIWLYDLLKSKTAERYHLVKEEQYNLNQELLNNAARLVYEISQPLNDIASSKGWRINRTSVYRCKDFTDKNHKSILGLNSLVGGSANPLSAHTDFRAEDDELYVNGVEASPQLYKEFCGLILQANIRFDKMILEFGTEKCPAWIHMQISQDKAIARRLIFRVGSFTNNKYIPFSLNDWSV